MNPWCFQTPPAISYKGCNDRQHRLVPTAFLYRCNTSDDDAQRISIRPNHAWRACKRKKFLKIFSSIEGVFWNSCHSLRRHPPMRIASHSPTSPARYTIEHIEQLECTEVITFQLLLAIRSWNIAEPKLNETYVAIVKYLANPRGSSLEANLWNILLHRIKVLQNAEYPPRNTSRHET